MKWSIALVCVLGFSAQAQIFSPLPQPPAPTGVPGPRPVSGPILGVNPQALRAALAAAPLEQLDADLDTYGLHLSLPDPTGVLIDCVIAESPVMEPALASRFPDIKTYILRSADGLASGRLEVAPRGITAMIRTPDGVWMMDPWQSADPAHIVTYWLRDLPGGGDWACGADINAPENGPPVNPAGTYTPRSNQTRRTYRLAMACTGEFGLHHSTLAGHAPNVADPLAAIVTITARTNVIYEADFAIHFNLVANNDQVIFFDPDTDPYSATCDGGGGTDCSANYLAQNASTLSTRIGNSNFDIGHVVSRVFGGVANLRSVCTSNKARGASGIPRGGDADPFTALVVIHEIGHQFGANHTFSGTRGRCAGNVNLSTAWEAGGGSTPMAYPGGCPVGDAPPTDNLVQFADPFFHHGSYLEMQAFLAGTGGNCDVTAATANAIPEITATSGDRAIPPGTPFILNVVATDANSDALTYSWEQYDSGVARPLSGDGSDDNGAGALFRAFPPVLSPSRTFPRMEDVLSGIPTPGERLPTVTGVTRRFRAMVRDNAPGAGGVAVSPFVNLFIASGATPFTVTSPAEGASLPTGDATLTWTVGGTNLAPISCATVTVRLSTDNGLTFPTVLGSFPNTGTASIALPDTATPTARLRIDADGGIFFAVSRPFEIREPCIADLNQDGGVDGGDVEYFFGIWSAGVTEADLNQDGGVDGGDVEYFFFRWEAGC